MAIVISGNGIDMGNNPVSNASQIDGTVINENGSNVISQGELAYDISTSSFIPNTLTSGAIIERGSNANGEYVKFADGTLICRNIDTINLNGYNSGVYRQINFPHTFLNNKYSLSVYGWRAADDSIMFFLRGGSIRTVNTFNITTSTNDSALGTRFDYVAIGRWK